MVFKKKNKDQSFGSSSSLVDGQTKNSKRRMSNTKLKLVIAVLIVFAVVTVVGAWFVSQSGSEEKVSDEQKVTQDFVNSDSSKATQARLVKEYGPKYDEISARIYKSNPAQWDKAALDEAYIALLYADKMQSYSQVSFFLSSILVAENAGMDIDDNSYGVNQDIRDAIKDRTKAATEKRKETDPKVKAELEKVL